MSRLLEVDGLRKVFDVGGHAFASRGQHVAMSDVSFSLETGKTLAIVGESGSGKSTLARCVLRLLEPTTGSIRFNGEDILAAKGRSLRRFRRSAQVIFQNPQGSLDPRMRVEAIVAEPLRYHEGLRKRELSHRVEELLVAVGLSSREARKLPHQLSGGQQQRVAIARAIATRPQLLVLDEPTSALDASVQGQVLELLNQLQRSYGMSYLLISHDLRLVERSSDHVLALYRGEVAEYGPTKAVFDAPAHPYVRLLKHLMPAVPPDPLQPRAVGWLLRETTKPADGCPFRTRCPLATSGCEKEQPLQPVAGEHVVACWRNADTSCQPDWAGAVRQSDRATASPPRAPMDELA